MNAADGSAHHERIGEPYLLVLNVPLCWSNGRYWADPLWIKDLLLHLDYIDRLTLFCPIDRRAPPGDWAALDHPNLTIIDGGPSGWPALLALPRTAIRLNRAVARAAIIHTLVAGWPVPFGWLATPLARLRGRFLLIIIESSFWRAQPGASLRRRLSGWLQERINRACVNAADMALFTTDQYRRTLATRPRGASEITPASWLDDAHILSEQEARAKWRAKPDRLLFAGRLIEDKGVATLLAALEQCAVAVDLIGEGPLAEACRRLAARHPERIRLLAPVSYGAAFSELIDGYAGIVVPTLSDEQPRILFDAFARAVPAITSDTPANVELVGDPALGLLSARGDPAALAQAMTTALQDRPRLEAAGLRARAFATSRTHRAMHRDRARLLRRALDAWR